MADNIATTVGASIATDDIGGVHFQRFKLAVGADGINDGDVSAANPLPTLVAEPVLIDDTTPIAVSISGTSPVSISETVNTAEQPAIVVEKIDQASATTTYIGQATPGTATSVAGWRIQRISVSGTVTTLEYADGDISYNNIWDNRASLTYM